ncbi:outer membrane beta-barrel protein [Fulvivirgaceae bacterium PWU4]|uniref:Outer membrane beta-barrel protein n=1 Tax=Chryseosolibacter histidini TaxID=2782349 RepID=A0AAP2GNM2_9BACT|nr:outer membrane beta-barrel protein [Chryseosolibacter histidini]MBT1698168.1 outer membrane beta-barrel protein [Chryseosolibacter histidini]
MMRKAASIAIVLTLILTFNAIAQSTQAPKKSRPDIPGTFALELGVNRLTEKPNQLKYGFWGSRTLNLYYLYDMRIAQSKFSFHPGIGFGMERFKLMRSEHYTATDTITYQNPTLMFDNVGNTVFVNSLNYIYDADSLGQVNWVETYATRKSMLVLNYVDIPVEFRFSTNPDDPARSFKLAVGGRVGYLLNAHTKIKYKENGELKKLKNVQDFNLNHLRYSVYMKVYLGNFALFGYYNLNPLFESGKGPMQTKAASYTIGISLASF